MDDRNKRNAILQEQKSGDAFFLVCVCVFSRSLFVSHLPANAYRKKRIRDNQNRETERQRAQLLRYRDTNEKFWLNLWNAKYLSYLVCRPPGSASQSSQSVSFTHSQKWNPKCDVHANDFEILESVFFNPLLKHNKYDFHEFLVFLEWHWPSFKSVFKVFQAQNSRFICVRVSLLKLCMRKTEYEQKCIERALA